MKYFKQLFLFVPIVFPLYVFILPYKQWVDTLIKESNNIIFMFALIWQFISIFMLFKGMILLLNYML